MILSDAIGIKTKPALRGISVDSCCVCGDCLCSWTCIFIEQAHDDDDEADSITPHHVHSSVGQSE